MSCLSVEKIWHKLFVVAVICSFEMTVTPAVAQSDETFDVVSVLSDTKTADTEVKLWRIDRPEVRKAHQAYKQIRFRPGDTIIIDAGGCVQTGGSGKTWKSYTRPMGDNSETFYSGTIRIPGVIELGDGEYARVGGVLHKEWKIPSHLPPTHPETDLYLRLGYQDDDYHDNGYYDHDDGNPPQCVNKGPAWVQIKVVSDLRVPEGPAAPSPSAGANYSPHSRPFDVVWDFNSGIDGNWLPLNPIWAYQIHNSNKPDFQATCGSAFPQGNIDAKELAAICTSQAPTADLADISPLLNFPSPGTPAALLNELCPSDPISGHLNWGIATFFGSIDWSGFEKAPWLDGDYNLTLDRPTNVTNTDYDAELFEAANAALTSESAGLGLEFNADETVFNFQSPWWKQLVEVVDKGDDEAHQFLDNHYAVVTGLFGVDGVHGYSESHPVFSIAIRTDRRTGSDSIDETWAFFLRNTGNEGECSQYQHDWFGLDGWYYLQVPWPKGATGVSLVQDGWQSWTYEQSGIGPAKLEQDSRWTYIGFQVPVTSAGPLVDGEITLHYTIKPGSLSGFRLPAGIVSPPKHPQQGPAGGEHHTPSDDLMVLARRIRDPAARQRFEQALRTLEPIRSTPRPHRISVTVNPRIAVRKPSTGPAHEGRLTRARARVDPTRQKARAEQIKGLVEVLKASSPAPR